jgi:hypothetical protein
VNGPFADALADRPPGRFGHEDHLYVAWRIVREHGAEEGGRLFADGLRSLTEQQGRRDKYHETLTAFWLRLVAHCVADAPDLGDFQAFLAGYPLLGDSSIAGRHWSDDTLWSTEARGRWVAPDLLPLPERPTVSRRPSRRPRGA